MTSWLVGFSMGYAKHVPVFGVGVLKVLPVIFTTLAFAMLFRLVPNRYVPRSHALIGALVAAIVIIAPKVINSGEVRTRIESVVAKELHGTVNYGRVELARLPSPDVVLHGFSIDLPGSLSATAAEVRVRARLLPLFRGRFMVSSVSFVRPEIYRRAQELLPYDRLVQAKIAAPARRCAR